LNALLHFLEADPLFEGEYKQIFCSTTCRVWRFLGMKPSSIIKNASHLVKPTFKAWQALYEKKNKKKWSVVVLNIFSLPAC